MTQEHLPVNFSVVSHIFLPVTKIFVVRQLKKQGGNGKKRYTPVKKQKA